MLPGLLHGPPTHAERHGPLQSSSSHSGWHEFAGLLVADLMIDCEGGNLDAIPATVTQATSTRTRRASLQRMITYYYVTNDGGQESYDGAKRQGCHSRPCGTGQPERTVREGETS